MRISSKTSLCVLLASMGGVFSLHAASKPSAIQYNRDIRPILTENCFSCHGADSASRKAGLRIDRPEDATARLADGVTAIIPGDASQSELVKRVFDDGDDVMPPVKSHKVLTPRQKQLLRQWVVDGAHYEPHWAFISPVKATPPKVHDRRWVRNPIDAFVLDRLEKENLRPAPEADRRTLARRVCLDLTGLPPEPEEVEAFVKDKSPDAYEKLVDKYLASPRWGEHRGRYWLDAARYGDTHGIHMDNYREIWIYREWVVKAFNRNMPFDRFTIEQLAGDLLPNPTMEQRIATGFNRCNITTSEGGAIDEEYNVLYARDRTETTSQVFLGLTAGCAVCHDHKYDPISQKEFYSLSAFFNNTTQQPMDGNAKDTPPVIVVPKPEDGDRWTELPKAKSAADEEIEARKKSARVDFEKWMSDREYSRLPTGSFTNGLVFHAPLDRVTAETTTIFTKDGGQTLQLGFNAEWQAGAVASNALTLGKAMPPAQTNTGDFSRDKPFSYSVWAKYEGEKTGALFARMEDAGNKYRGWDLWMEGRSPAIHILNSWPDNGIKVVSKGRLPEGKWSHICISYDGSSKAAGVSIYINGEKQEVSVEKDNLRDDIHTAAPFKFGQRDTGGMVAGAAIEDLRIYDRIIDAQEAKNLAEIPRIQWLASRFQPNATHTAAKAENEELYAVWLGRFDEPYNDFLLQKRQLAAEEMEIKRRGTVAHVMQEKDGPEEAYLLNRGEYDQRRDKLAAAVPAVFPPMATNTPRNRLGLALWLVRPDHPLTARVTVNRFWQELFGTGIVRTSGDFGIAGEQPSNQPLLDWLAVDFREHNWDVKRMYKLMVMSATYRQSARTTPEKEEKDPLNRLMSRGPRFRMDAEMIRDSALEASGLLVEKIGGPSVKPYQPAGIWESITMGGSDTHSYTQGKGDDLYRRSVYTFWKRSAPPASLDLLNAPSRQTSCVRRERTDTPIQALVTLDDPQFVEASRMLAEHALRQGGKTPEERVDYMAERLISRPFSRKEQSVVKGVLNDMLEHYRKSPQAAEALVATGESKADASLDKPTLAAYTMVASEIMNLDENLSK